MDAVCSRAFRRSEAMLVPRHMSLDSAGPMPMAQASCGGDEEPDELGGVAPEAAMPAETGARPGGGATEGAALRELSPPYGDWYMGEQALVVMEGRELGAS